ncbi:hypothetical protein ACC695_40410, partial [Rhizobium ruizarguesonis]
MARFYLLAVEPTLFGGSSLAIVWRYLPQLVPWLRAFLASSTKDEVERIAGTLAVLLSHADAAWQPLVMQ